MENKNLIGKSNALIDAYYSLTVREHQFIAFAVASIPRNDIKLEKLEVTIDIRTFTEFFQLDEKRIMPNQLLASADKLYERDIRIIEGKTETRCRWLTSIKKHEEGKVILRFSPEILPHLTGLRENYTLYTIGVLKNFKSQYTFPVYELLAKTRNMREEIFCISIENLREKLEIGNKYKLFADLRKKVIEPVFSDLENCTDLNISWELIKKGRTYTHIQIIFTESKAATPPKKKAKSKRAKKITDAHLAKHAKPGETSEQARARLSKVLA